MRNHIILSDNVASVRLKKDIPPSFPLEERVHAPPVTILVTGTPYGTERASGAIALGVAMAAQGILARVIFIEDGVYALTGVHRMEEDTRAFNLQELINVVAGNENLQFFAFRPSLHKRGLTKNPKLNAVMDIGIQELGQLIFSPPKGMEAGHQRILFF